MHASTEQTCSDKLAFIRVVHHSLEQGVCKQASAAPEGAQVPDNTAAVAAGTHTLIATAGLHFDAVHCSLVLLCSATNRTGRAIDCMSCFTTWGRLHFKAIARMESQTAILYNYRGAAAGSILLPK